MGEGRETSGDFPSVTSQQRFLRSGCLRLVKMRKMRKMRKNEESGISLWESANDFQAVSPSSFLRTFVSRRALTG